MTEFAFLSEIPMDKTHTLDQMTGRFQTVKDGVPELVKNSKDQYMRRGVSDRKDRQIVVLVDFSGLSLGVLDFAGARVEDFRGWQTWSSRTASQAEISGDIEGGHGNGGKSFMVRGSTLSSYMDSCSDGVRTKMGFDNDKPERRYFPGYGIIDHKQINSIPDKLARRDLDADLAELGHRFEDLPKAAQEAFEKRKAFTLVRVGGVRDWMGRRRSSVHKMVHEIPAALAAHAQAALTIDTCSIWVVAGRKLLTKQPLAREYPEPFPGFEDLASIPVPSEILDPRIGEMVSTGRGGSSDKYLRLSTSAKQLRMTEDRKALNTIRVRNDRNVVANWPVARLAPRAESAFIFGEVFVPDLQGEHLADSHRTELADTPLARALEQWVTEQIDALAQRIQKALARETKKEDQAKARHTLEQLRDLMREYLSAEPSTLEEEEEGEGEEGPAGHRRKAKRPKTPHGKAVNEILFEPGSDRLALAVGSTVPLLFRCYEIDQDGGRHPVVGANLTLEATHPGIIQLKGSDFLVALKEGDTEVWLRDRATGVESNHIRAEALVCAGVDIVGPQEPLMQGQRVRLRASFQSSKGPRDDFLVEGAIDEVDAGRISRTGFFTAGMREGDATVRVRWGPGRGNLGVASIAIGSEVMPPTGRGGKGADIPLILLCGEEAPGMEEYPKDMRTHHGGDHHPTIIEEPLYGHVVWINPHSKESLRVRQSRGGSVGIGGVASKTFTQFAALKCFEILKRLRVRQELRDSSVTETEFTRQIAQAEVDCAGFIDSAYAIAEDLYKE